MKNLVRLSADWDGSQQDIILKIPSICVRCVRILDDLRNWQIIGQRQWMVAIRNLCLMLPLFFWKTPLIIAFLLDNLQKY